MEFENTFDLGDAWTLTQSTASIRDAGYDGTEELALLRNDAVVLAAASVIEVRAWMSAHADLHDRITYLVLPATQLNRYCTREPGRV